VKSTTDSDLFLPVNPVNLPAIPIDSFHPFRFNSTSDSSKSCAQDIILMRIIW
jgi:hypothetical protein